MLGDELRERRGEQAATRHTEPAGEGISGGEEVVGERDGCLHTMIIPWYNQYCQSLGWKAIPRSVRSLRMTRMVYLSVMSPVTDSPVGRNDPCPCGSGKKYKKCHGVAASEVSVRPDVARANALKAADTELVERLMGFAATRYGRQWILRAFDAYLDREGDDISDRDVPLAIPWALRSMPATTKGLTLAEEWRRAQAKELSPERRILLDAYAASWLSVWEVAEVERGVGVALTDQLTREKRFVHDVASSTTLGPFDTIFAFVLDCDGVSFFGGVHGQPLPPREADVVIREARRICRVRTRPVSLDSLRDVDTQIDLVALWNVVVDELTARPAPTLTNTDGDPFVLTTDDFELLAAREEVAQLIESIEGVQEPQLEGNDLAFAVIKPGNAQNRSWDNTLVGRIILTARRLRLETNSTRRADTLRARVETRLGRTVRFRLRTETNTEDLLATARASAQSGEKRPDDRPPPEAIAAMREFRERHMTAWLDDAIPALGGLTPRAAARSPRSRAALEVLLKDFDRSEARLPAEERIDVSRLRVELGMKAP